MKTKDLLLLGGIALAFFLFQTAKSAANNAPSNTPPPQPNANNMGGNDFGVFGSGW